MEIFCRVYEAAKTVSHQFMVVFHFPPESPITSADIEDDIAEAVGNELDDPYADHVVDGNEIGDSIDVFMASCNPEAAFSLCRPMLKRLGLLETTVVAFRAYSGGAFQVLHPLNFNGEFTV